MIVGVVLNKVLAGISRTFLRTPFHDFHLLFFFLFLKFFSESKSHFKKITSFFISVFLFLLYSSLSLSFFFFCSVPFLFLLSNPFWVLYTIFFFFFFLPLILCCLHTLFFPHFYPFLFCWCFSFSLHFLAFSSLSYFSLLSISFLFFLLIYFLF